MMTRSRGRAAAKRTTSKSRSRSRRARSVVASPRRRRSPPQLVFAFTTAVPTYETMNKSNQLDTVGIVARTSSLFAGAKAEVEKLLLINVCRGSVRADYVLETFGRKRKSITHIALILDSTKTPKGFITLHQRNRYAFIDVLCAMPGYGLPLMTSTLQWADDSNVTDVELHALPSVLFFYQRFGFNFRPSCDVPSVGFSDEDMAMYKEYSTANNISTYSDAANDPYTVQFLQFLQQQSLNVKKGMCPPSASADEIAVNDCAVDGYEMHKCKL